MGYMLLYYLISAFALAALCISFLREGREYAGVAPVKSEDSLRVYRWTVWTLFTILILVLWFLTGFRTSSIGNDTPNYIRAFYANMSDIATGGNMEMGFKAVCHAIGKVTSDGNVFLLIVATISYAALYIIVLRSSKSPLFSFCLIFALCFSSLTNMMRQSLSSILCLIGIMFYYDGHKVPYYVFVALATTMHTSAIAMLALPLFCSLSQKATWVVMGLVVIIAALSLSGILNPLLSRITPTRYANYYVNSRSETGALGTSVGVATALITYALLRYSYGGSEKGKLPIAISLFSLMMSLLGFTTNIFNRLDMCCSFAMIILLPNAIYEGRIEHKELVSLGICVFEVALFIVIRILRPDWNHLYPWESWLWQ